MHAPEDNDDKEPERDSGDYEKRDGERGTEERR